MAKFYPKLETHHRDFIAAQRIFFTASAPPDGRVNVSPRSTDLLRILSDNRALYLDRTGSGNETAAHMRAGGRLTVMFCAFEGPPLIMRLFGRGMVIARGSAAYADLLGAEFDNEEPLGARQMMRIDFDVVQTSCGFGVPLFDYVEERPHMDRWARAKGVDGIEAYWREKNLVSMDGLPTGLLDDASEEVMP